MKIIKIMLLLISLGFTSVNAEGTSETQTTDIQYYVPQYEPKLEYTIDGNKVHFEWSMPENEEEFKYYKLVFSAEKAKPVYPDDRTVIVEGNINRNKASSYHNKGYWRVCHVFAGFYNEWQKEQYRACSNVIYLGQNTATEIKKGEKKSESIDWNYIKEFKEFMSEKDDMSYESFKEKVYSELEDDIERGIINYKTSGEVKKYISQFLTKIKNREKNNATVKEVTTKNISSSEKTNKLVSTNTTIKKSVLSAQVRKKADALISKFDKKLQSSKLSNEEKVRVINGIISKLQSISKSKPTLKSLINYLVQKLENVREEYQNDFEDIEKLFDF